MQNFHHKILKQQVYLNLTRRNVKKLYYDVIKDHIMTSHHYLAANRTMVVAQQTQKKIIVVFCFLLMAHRGRDFITFFKIIL